MKENNIPNKLFASKLHTIILISILILISVLSSSLNNSHNVTSSKVSIYISLIIGEWALFYYVWRGLKRNKVSISKIIFNSEEKKILFKDVLIAFGFWIISFGILILIKIILNIPIYSRTMFSLLPHSFFEIFLFFLLSLSVGFCEEIIYRGYLQHQFSIIFKSRFIGIVLQAFLFGISHGYQGYQNMIVISVYGLLFGLLIYYVKNLKPVIISHAWQDIFSGIILQGL